MMNVLLVYIIHTHADPSLFEYEKNPPIKDLNLFNSELFLNSVPSDSIPFWSKTAVVFTSFYRVCVESCDDC